MKRNVDSPSDCPYNLYYAANPAYRYCIIGICARRVYVDGGKTLPELIVIFRGIIAKKFQEREDKQAEGKQENDVLD